MHFFGTFGILLFLVGFGIFGYLGVDKIFINKGARLIAERTEFFLAITSMIIGSQMFLAGYLGEMISINSSKRDDYNIAEKINI